MEPCQVLKEKKMLLGSKSMGSKSKETFLNSNSMRTCKGRIFKWAFRNSSAENCTIHSSGVRKPNERLHARNIDFSFNQDPTSPLIIEFFHLFFDVFLPLSSLACSSSPLIIEIFHLFLDDFLLTQLTSLLESCLVTTSIQMLVLLWYLHPTA